MVALCRRSLAGCSRASVRFLGAASLAGMTSDDLDRVRRQKSFHFSRCELFRTLLSVKWDETIQARRRRLRITVGVAIFVLLYLLSPGPLSRAYQVGVASEHLVFQSRVWLPLDWLCRVPAIQAFYDWYLPLWDVRNAPDSKHGR